MSLRGYIKKGKQAPWVAAFPRQASGLGGRIDRGATATETRRRDKTREDARYRKQAREFIKQYRRAGAVCPVVAAVKELREAMRSGHEVNGELVSGELNEVHHMFGRLGDLLRWQPGWVAVSKAGHRWIHGNIEKARALGFLCEPGDWNKRPDELVPAAEKMRSKISCVLESIMIL